MGVTASLVLARLRYRPARFVLLILGVALAVALLVVARAQGELVAARSAGVAVAQLPPGERSLAVSYNGFLDAREQAQIGNDVQRRLAPLSQGRPQPQLLFREISDNRGSTFFVGATDGLASHVRLKEGRLPTSCTPTRCELVRVEVPGAPTVDPDPTLGFVVVGTVERTDPLLLSGTFNTGAGVPLLLGDGVAAVGANAALDAFGRTYGWVAPIDLQRVLREGVPGYLRQSAAAFDLLFHDRMGLILTTPDQALLSAQSRADRSGRRFALLGAFGSVLLLGFAALAAAGMRPRHEQLVGLLRQRGARPSTLVGVTVGELLAVVLLGAVLGVAGASTWAAIEARNAGLTASGLTRHAAEATLPALIVLMAGSVALCAWILLSRRPSRRAVERTLDVVVVGAIAMAWLLLARGGVSTKTLDRGVDPVLVALPALMSVAVAALAARLWSSLSPTVARLVPSNAFASRLALLGGTRRILRPAATAGFVAAAVLAVVFAAAYGSTLAQGAQDQAAFGVPLDVRLTAGPSGQVPSDVVNLASLNASTGSRTYGVVRASAAVHVSAVSTTPVTLLGLEPNAIRDVRRWGRTVGVSDPDRSAALLGSTGAEADRSGQVPKDARNLVIPLTGGSAPGEVSLTLWTQTDDGRETSRPLALDGDALTADLTGLPAGSRWSAITVREAPDYATRHQHALGESGLGVEALVGSISMGSPHVDGREVSWEAGGQGTGGEGWAGWQGSGGEVVTAADSLRVAYKLDGTQVVITPKPGPTPVAVLTDPQTAAAADHGTLRLGLAGDAVISVRVAGTLTRFPTVGERFVLFDRSALTRLLDQVEPGTGAVREIWVSGGPATVRALERPPADRLEVAVRTDTVRRLQGDPIAVGSLALLRGTAALAIALAVVAMALLVSSERRDSAGELMLWEADGVAPKTLRRVLFVRGLSVGLLAVPLGVIGGVVLARIGAAVIAVGASGSATTPPLKSTVGGVGILVVTILGCLLVTVVCLAMAARALREPLPVRRDLDAT